jgi:NAD(P)-dependent dehydrogenase (short-subunit alcohol dehydrogenase family)
MAAKTILPSPPVDEQFLGNVITVTGGASGIGLATVQTLYERGASVAFCDFNATTLAEAEKTISAIPPQAGQRLMATLVDVSKPAEVNRWIESVVSKFGKLDHAANVAGVGETVANLAEKTDAEFDRIVDINLRGVFNCMRAQLPHLKEGSSIVNVSSGSGLHGNPGNSIYSAAKAGVNTMTAAAAKEYGPKGIRVNVVSPGVTLTPAMLSIGLPYLEPSIQLTPMRRGAQPVELATTIAFLLSKESSFITGVVLRCDGGYLTLGH